MLLCPFISGKYIITPIEYSANSITTKPGIMVGLGEKEE
jgi:lipoate synthase